MIHLFVETYKFIMLVSLNIAAAKIEETTAADDQRHATASMETGDVVVNMALATSACDLHKKCC